MAITQFYLVNVPIAGDGVSTSVTVDLAKQIDALPVLPREISRVLDTAIFVPAITSTSFSGTQLTLNFATAPADGRIGLAQIYLGF